MVCALPSPFGRHHTRFLRGYTGFVFDLAPWDGSAVEVVRLIRSEYPILPILAFTPNVPGATELVIECGSIAGVSAQTLDFVLLAFLDRCGLQKAKANKITQRLFA